MWRGGKKGRIVLAFVPRWSRGCPQYHCFNVERTGVGLLPPFHVGTGGRTMPLPPHSNMEWGYGEMDKGSRIERGHYIVRYKITNPISSPCVQRSGTRTDMGSKEGWHAWLSVVAREAIKGWIPHKADTFEKLDKGGRVYDSKGGQHEMGVWLSKLSMLLLYSYALKGSRVSPSPLRNCCNIMAPLIGNGFNVVHFIYIMDDVCSSVITYHKHFGELNMRFEPWICTSSIALLDQFGLGPDDLPLTSLCDLATDIHRKLRYYGEGAEANPLEKAKMMKSIDLEEFVIPLKQVNSRVPSSGH
eukprot:Gb_15974 [translate_table: standard]